MRSHAFGPFGLDPAERLLLRGGQPVALTPKAFDLLVYLVERHGRLVEKQELMAALWPDAVVEEANLAYNISAVRRALGDGQEGEQFIQTVPTRGYRFVAPVRELPAASAGPTATPAHPRRRLVAPSYDLTADGRRLLMIKPAPPSPAPSRLVVVENLFSELREKLGP
jgi:DNA-binding winged helix-turn-helix (wHTH) protein